MSYGGQIYIDLMEEEEVYEGGNQIIDLSAYPDPPRREPIFIDLTLEEEDVEESSKMLNEGEPEPLAEPEPEEDLFDHFEDPEQEPEQDQGSDIDLEAYAEQEEEYYNEEDLDQVELVDYFWINIWVYWTKRVFGRPNVVWDGERSEHVFWVVLYELGMCWIVNMC